MIKVVSDLREVGDFLLVFWFPPPIKLTTMTFVKYCWKYVTLTRIVRTILVIYMYILHAHFFYEKKFHQLLKSIFLVPRNLKSGNILEYRYYF